MIGCEDYDRYVSPGSINFELEIPITFQSGVGVTRAVSFEEVRFTTAAPLTAGQQLTGMLLVPTGNPTVASLCYVARVVGVLRSASDGQSEVSARFEAIQFKRV
jgi:hypothetical protein